MNTQIGSTTRENTAIQHETRQGSLRQQEAQSLKVIPSDTDMFIYVRLRRLGSSLTVWLIKCFICLGDSTFAVFDLMTEINHCQETAKWM